MDSAEMGRAPGESKLRQRRLWVGGTEGWAQRRRLGEEGQWVVHILQPSWGRFGCAEGS